MLCEGMTDVIPHNDTYMYEIMSINGALLGFPYLYQVNNHTHCAQSVSIVQYWYIPQGSPHYKHSNPRQGHRAIR